MSTLKLGIFGFGCVGQGLHTVLTRTKGLDAEIKKICIKHAHKERPLDASLFTTDRDELLNDPEIDIIVELIDDAQAAYEIVTTAFQNKKHVVSANKKMIAEHLPELLRIKEENEVSFLYEASSCASIPIIRNLEEYYDNDMLSSVKGIFNGSTNFILTKLINEGGDYSAVLKEAQDLGFAESDPTLDVEGIDAKYKLCIVLFHAFGVIADPDLIFSYGITKINPFDIAYARKNDLGIKLLANCKRIDDRVQAFVAPAFVPKGSVLYNTENEYNAVVMETAFAEQQVLVGKGAGDKPTGSAVLSDISALNYGYQYENKKKSRNKETLELSSAEYLRVYVRYEHQNEPDFSNFQRIEEQFSGANGQYIIGTIAQHELENAAWAHDEKINIIVFDQ